MRNLILFTLSTLALLTHPLSLSAQNSFSISLDVNSAASDQDVTPDFDGDGMVGFSDFLAFAGLFGSRQGDGRYEAKYDLDSDGAIGFSDFLIFSASFGKEVSTPGGDATHVAIPDANLRAVIADSLGKAGDAPITQAEMATLTHLAAPNKNIRDLTGLEFAINLTELVLGGNQGRLWEVNSTELFNNLSLYLTTLIELWTNFSFNFSVNSISDVTPLSNLTNLRSLTLSANNISDVVPLSNLIRLEWLDLSGNSIANVAPIANLTSLEWLELDNNGISDVTPLSNLTNLRWLELSDNSIADMTPISNATRLELLSLFDNSIANVTPISNLINLTGLELDDNSISNVTPLSNLINLTGLELNNNSISDLAPLVANAGLGEEDWVEVRNNPLSATSINIHIPALESRGVDVDFSVSKPPGKNKEPRMPPRMIEPFGMKKWKVGDNLRKGHLNNF